MSLKRFQELSQKRIRRRRTPRFPAKYRTTRFRWTLSGPKSAAAAAAAAAAAVAAVVNIGVDVILCQLRARTRARHSYAWASEYQLQGRVQKFALGGVTPSPSPLPIPYSLLSSSPLPSFFP